jgi:hypothetical protein
MKLCGVHLPGGFHIIVIDKKLCLLSGLYKQSASHPPVMFFVISFLSTAKFLNLNVGLMSPAAKPSNPV